MKFEDVKEALEWFVEACVAQGACEGTFDAMCELEQDKRNKLPIADVSIVVDPEEAMDAKIDIELCMKDMAEHEKAALCVYGVMDYRHAAHCLCVKLQIRDVFTYVEMHRDDGDPGISGCTNRKMSKLVHRLEDRLIEAGYLRSYLVTRKFDDSLEDAA